MRILIVEDEEKLAHALMEGLTKKGYAVDFLTEGDVAFERLTVNHTDYDLVILDLMLPGMEGMEICRKLREQNVTVPILILTARDEVDNKVDLLLAGADDYMVKPFSFEELSARIQALLRRPTEMVPTVLTIREIRLNPSERTVHKNGKPIPLTLKEFVLLEYFMRRPNEVVNREDLLSHLWDFNYLGFSNVVDVHVRNLRKKFDSDILETVRGVGYRLKG